MTESSPPTPPHEALSIFAAFAHAREDLRQQAVEDLAAIRNGSKESISGVRFRAALHLAQEEIAKSIVAMFELFGPAATFESSPHMLGFDSETLIPPGHHQHVTVVAMDQLQLMYLIVDPSCAASFELIDRKVGSVSMMDCPSSIPCAVFTTENTILGPLSWQRIMPSQYATLVVRNIGTEPLRFRAVAFGQRAS